MHWIELFVRQQHWIQQLIMANAGVIVACQLAGWMEFGNLSQNCCIENLCTSHSSQYEYYQLFDVKLNFPKYLENMWHATCNGQPQLCMCQFECRIWQWDLSCLKSSLQPAPCTLHLATPLCNSQSTHLTQIPMQIPMQRQIFIYNSRIYLIFIGIHW